MATLINSEKVKYLCSCKQLKPLSNLYYCKYCKPFSLKCKECVLHELDQKYFCPYCFDNKVQKEVISLKFKCGTCYSCPCCKNSLIIRASSLISSQKAAAAAAAAAAANSVSLSNNNSQTSLFQSQSLLNTSNSPADSSQTTATTISTSQSQKVYYLICGFCRWSSRDVGIPDATSTPVNMKPEENIHTNRISELLKAYKMIASKEKLEKERKKYTRVKKRQFNIASQSISSVNSNPNALTGVNVNTSSPNSSYQFDKYGILAPVYKRIQSSSSNQNNDPTNVEKQFNVIAEKAKAVDSFAPLPDDFFTKNININSFTSINQRHSNPEIQSSRSIDLFPLNKLYVSKESKRCNGCEHNVLKPESNITSIKFKLHQMAIFLIPEVRIVTIPQWKIDKPNEVIISITNRYENDIKISFENTGITNFTGFRPTAKVNFGQNNEYENTFIQVDRIDSSKSQIAALKQSDQETNGFVCFRRENKIAICFQVIPFMSEIDENVKIVFQLKHSVINGQDTVSHLSPTSLSQSPATQNQFQTSLITQTITLDLGPLTIENGLKVINKPKYIDDCFIMSNLTPK